VLLSLAGLSQIEDIDVVHRTMRVQAGARVADVRRAAESVGLLFNDTNIRLLRVAGQAADLKFIDELLTQYMHSTVSLGRPP
jgi:FAD/FMN-containing dehydrogenase